MNSGCIPFFPQCLQATSDTLKFLDTIHSGLTTAVCIIYIIYKSTPRYREHLKYPMYPGVAWVSLLFLRFCFVFLFLNPPHSFLVLCLWH